MSLVVSISGIRGIFGTGLDPVNLVGFSTAYGQWIRARHSKGKAHQLPTGQTPSESASAEAQRPRIVVGRDTRTTGQICEDIVCATLQSVGCDVIRVGIAPTPTVAMGVLRHQAAGGIIISASHNPAQWNALKLLNEKSEFLDAQQGEQVLALMGGAGSEASNPSGTRSTPYPYRQWNEIGVSTHDHDLLDWHIARILEHPLIDPAKIAAAGFKIAVDAVNGAGSTAVPKLLQALGAQCVPLHCTPDGIFPHNPEPLPEHLHEICSFTASSGADLGVVTDPDADRLAIVDETGRLWGEEYTQAAAFDLVLSKRPGDTATNLSSSRVADEVTKRYGGTCHRSAVGEIHVVKKMQHTSAVIGGEGNGGVIDPTLHYGRDALVGIAMVLQLLAERGLSASAYRATLPTYHMSKQKVELNALGVDAASYLNAASDVFKALHPDTTDGVKIDFEQGWVHLRKSNTEPIVRFYSESGTQAQADDLVREVQAKVERALQETGQAPLTQAQAPHPTGQAQSEGGRP